MIVARGAKRAEETVAELKVGNCRAGAGSADMLGSAHLGRCGSCSLQLARVTSLISFISLSLLSCRSCPDRSRDTRRSHQTLAKPEQKVLFVTADLSDEASSARALHEAAASFGGRAPDHVFMCAGMARPMLFIDTTPVDLKNVSSAEITS